MSLTIVTTESNSVADGDVDGSAGEDSVTAKTVEQPKTVPVVVSSKQNARGGGNPGRGGRGGQNMRGGRGAGRGGRGRGGRGGRGGR